MKYFLFLFFCAYKLTAQVPGREYFLQHHIKEMKICSGRSAIPNEIVTLYYVNDSGLVYKELEYDYPADSVCFIQSTEKTYDRLNRIVKEQHFSLDSGKVKLLYTSEITYPEADSKCTITTWGEGKSDTLFSRVIEKHRKNYHKIKTYYNDHYFKSEISRVRTKENRRFTHYARKYKGKIFRRRSVMMELLDSLGHVVFWFEHPKRWGWKLLIFSEAHSGWAQTEYNIQGEFIRQCRSNRICYEYEFVKKS